MFQEIFDRDRDGDRDRDRDRDRDGDKGRVNTKARRVATGDLADSNSA